MKTFRLVFIILIMSGLIFQGRAHVCWDDLEFKQFSTPEGLPNSMVHQVYQDRDGYIWIPTFYGLFRYDGYEVRTYKSNLYTPGLLVNNNVLCVEEDYSHRLWIGTHEGLCMLDKRTGKMKKLQLDGVSKQRLNEIHVTKENRVYLGYIRGMAYYDEMQDTLALMTRKNCRGDVPESVNIQTLFEDVNGDLLIGTWKDGLYRYCIKENTFLHYPPLDEENSVLALFQDSRGVMWIGTSGSGLYKAHFSSDRKTVSFEGYRHDARNVSSLPSDYIYSIHEDLQTRSLWLGTREGVSVMELADEGKFINYQESGSTHYLPVREVNTVFRDRSGLMWIGTKGAGVFHVDTRKRSFNVIYPRGNDKSFTDLISTLYVEENGALWIGMGYGLDYQHGDKKVTLFPSKRPYHISYSSLTREVLLAVHDEGMIVCRDGQIIHQYKTSNCGFVPHDLVYLVHEDRKGNRWLCTYKEIFAGSDVAKDKDNSGSSNVTARQNYFGRINYAYKDKYLTEFTMRYDGSMNFAPGHRWGVFPAFSLGWVMSEEEFFQPLKNVVSFFKVKGSWGMMGNDNVTAYQYMSQYKFIDLNNTSSMCFGDEVVKAIYESRTANPLITWEKAKTWNLGFSSQFLDGKFGLDFDYFQSRRNDILITRNASIPTYSGLVLPAENLGKVKNHGLELIATYRDHSGDFSWGITGNFTYANNKVVYEDEAASTPEWQRRTGHPIDGMVLYKALGIYQTQEQVDNTPHIAGAKPGDLIYQDTNGDGNITWDDAIRLDKSATPKIIFGLTLNGAWKGWDLNVFFQGQADAEQLVQPTMNMATDFYEGRWIETNTAEQNAAAKWPRAFIKQTYGDAWNGVASTWWLRDASFVRLKSIELGYTLPKMWTKSIGIENARIYVNGNNLFTIDGMKICDPEAGMFKNTDGYVVESGGVRGYPLQRMITVGANVTF